MGGDEGPQHGHAKPRLRQRQALLDAAGSQPQAADGQRGQLLSLSVLTHGAPVQSAGAAEIEPGAEPGRELLRERGRVEMQVKNHRSSEEPLWFLAIFSIL